MPLQKYVCVYSTWHFFQWMEFLDWTGLECDPGDMSASQPLIPCDSLVPQMPRLEVKDAWELTPVTPLGLQKSALSHSFAKAPPPPLSLSFSPSVEPKSLSFSSLWAGSLGFCIINSTGGQRSGWQCSAQTAQSGPFFLFPPYPSTGLINVQEQVFKYSFGNQTDAYLN